MFRNRKKLAEYTSILMNLKFIYQETLRKDRKLAAAFIFKALLQVASTLTALLFPRFLIRELIGEQRMIYIGGLLIAFFVLGGLFNCSLKWMEQFFYSRMIVMRFRFREMHQETCLSIKYEYFERPEYLDRMYAADKCLQANNTGIEGIMHRLFQLPGNALSVLACLTILTSLHFGLVLFLICNMAVLCYTAHKCRKVQLSYRPIMMRDGRHERYYHNIINDFSYAKELRLYHLSKWILTFLRNCWKKQIQTQKKMESKIFWIRLIELALEVLRNILTYGYVILQILRESIGVADFTMYISTIFSAMEKCFLIIDDMAFLVMQNPDINDFRSFICEAAEDSKKMDMPAGPYTIEFQHVFFRYPGKEDYVVKDVSFTIRSGTRLALVGKNGSGKTTLLKLLMGLYTVSEGKILCNGMNIADLDREQYFRIFSTVFQDVVPLEYTLAENISLQDVQSQDVPRINDCLYKVGLWDKIRVLPEGIHTFLGKSMSNQGIQLSGGETQQLLIARALYHDGEIMIMDEPASALDPLREQEIYKLMDKLAKDKTGIYVSHRLVSTQWCDQVFLLEDGRILESGSHETLMRKNGAYAQMWKIQAQYYQKGVEAN